MRLVLREAWVLRVLLDHKVQPDLPVRLVLPVLRVILDLREH